MMESTLARAAAVMRGVLRGADGAFRGVSTDTRSLRAGELFFALHGPNFDGVDFLPAAAERQAAGAVVPRPVETPLAHITVRDTRLALGDLAASWRRQMSAKVVGVTGSNGKTTLKEMVASCLRLSAETLATDGNLNNDIGLPLMLARLSQEHRYAVLEMGANHAGEIAYLTRLAAPHVVAITNAGAAHLEGFGSVEGVARAKGEILDGEPRPECAVLNADDRYFEYWRSRAADVPVLSFGLGPAADVRATGLEPTDEGTAFRLELPEGGIRVEMPMAGTHNVVNACAAAAVATALGLPATQIRSGLQSVRPIGGRLRRLEGPAGSTLYDDSYNANPTSLLAAAEFIAGRPGKGWLVLGDMAELGADAEALHRVAGEKARAAGVERLFVTGALSRHTAEGFGAGAEWFESIEDLTAALMDAIRDAGVSVLIKGSRSSRMERVVEALADPTGGRES